MKITDPVEQVVADVLDFHHFAYTHESDVPAQRFTFSLPKFDVFIECRSVHAGRLDGRLEEMDNVIVVQGLPAARAFARLLLEAC